MSRCILIAAVVLQSACMIYVPGGGGGGGGGGLPDGGTGTLHAQMLVMVNLDPGVVNLAPSYSELITGYQQALLQQNPSIIVDQIAIAPINQTTASGARFIYSENDPDPLGAGAQTVPDAGQGIGSGYGDTVDSGRDQEGVDAGPDYFDGVDAGPDAGPFDNPPGNTVPQQAIGNGTLLGQILEAALNFEYLPIDPTRGEQENLAELGATITQQSVYQSAGTNPNSVPAFTAPEDLFIVMTLAHLARDCGPTDTNCLINGQTPMAYFNAADSAGNASWLNFGSGQGVPVNHVFFLPIFTEEGVSSSTFVSDCSSQPGFPQAFIELIEPSPTAYYGPFAQAFSPSANVMNEDFCAMFSSDAVTHVVLDTLQIANIASGG